MVQGDDGRLALLRALDGWRRGFGAAPVVCQWGIAGPAVAGGAPGAVAAASVTTGMTGAAALASATTAAESAALTVTVSTGDVDRHGDVVSPEGWRLDSYRRNPVVLWAHDYRHPAIGRAPAVWQEGAALLARIEFAPTQFAGQVAALYRDGYQRGMSVGFRPLRFEERRDARSGAFLGIRFLEQELLEISAVPVPANRAALLRGWDGVGAGVGVGVGNGNSNRVMAGSGGEALLGGTPASAVVALLRGWDGAGVDIGGGVDNGNGNGNRVMAGSGGEALLGNTPASAVVALLRGWDGIGVGVGGEDGAGVGVGVGGEDGTGVGAGAGIGIAEGVMPGFGGEGLLLGDAPAASAVVALLRGLRG